MDDEIFELADDSNEEFRSTSSTNSDIDA